MGYKRTNTQDSSVRMSVGKKLLFGITVPIIAILLILALVVTTQVVSTIFALRNRDINNQISSVSNMIPTYFETFFDSEKYIMDRSSVKQLFNEMERFPATYRFNTSTAYQNAMEDLQYTSEVGGDAVQAAWIAGVKNNQVLQSNGYTTDESYQVTERIWYQMLLQKPGKSILTPAYEDVSTGEMVVTAATPYYNEAGEMIGAIGIDISLNELFKYFSAISIGETGYLTVFDSSGNLVYHPDTSLLLTNIADMPYSNNMVNTLNSHLPSEVDRYRYSNDTYYGGTFYIENFGWSVLASMPIKEYMHEISIIFYTLMIGFLLCIGACALLCLFRAKSIVKPLQFIGTVAKEFARGNLNSDIQRNTNDEIGDLEEVFAQTQVYLKEIISDIDHVVRELSDKNLTATTSAAYLGDFVQIENSLHTISDAMNDAMSQISIAASQVDSGASQVASGSQALAQGAAEQAESVEKLTSYAQEISANIAHNAKQAKAANSQTGNTKERLDQSSMKMKELVNAMEEIRQTSDQIRGIIKTIDDIAFQTNILALNAAVEAARAGTAGKGFAVVADEVRNLASKSAEASKTTQELIQNSILAVEHGSALAADTAKVLEETAEYANEVISSVSQIAATSAEQAESIAQMTEGLDQISSVVQMNSATAQESAAASEELSGQADMMKHLMESFQMKKR